ncbi:MAG: DUF5916 domain-containing protein [Gemmatimonadales bacterium]
MPKLIVRAGLVAAVAGMGWGAADVEGQTTASLASGPAVAGRAGALPRVAVAVRSGSEVTIDGIDADPVWRSAPATGGFRQFDPELDADPAQQTEFRVAYDDDNLYVFVRALDASPDSIMRALTRRDVRGPSDQIGIMIDSYHDRRTGFAFWVNPDGVQRDFAFSNDTNQDQSWNGVWDVATSVDERGWTAEFRIPLSQLRYASADQHTFGFGIRRQIDRYPESSSWPHYDRNNTGMMSQLGELQGLEGLGRSNRLEVTPYAVTKNVTRAGSGGGLEHPQEFSAGADVKLGITPNLTLDATVNPDFGQVEADPAQVNLSAFETFFGERRPFFLEGTGLYRFQLNCYIVVDCNTNEGLFYSRRIGRSPALSNQYGDALTPTATPIAAAAKLTGRRTGGLSFGILDAVTQQVTGASDQTVEPTANYAVLRAQQDFRNGEASVGWIGTAVNRSNDALTAPYLHESAYVTGFNVRNRFSGRRFELAGSFAASRVAGSAAAIARTQTSSAHYYQQPNDGPSVDSARTALSGYSGQLKFGKYGGGITRFETSFVYQSPGFEVNDLGYLRRADIYDWSTWAQLTFQSPTRLYRWASFNGNTWYHWNTSGDRIETSINLNGHMGLNNNWDVHAGGTIGRLGGAFCDRCTRGGPLLRRDVSFFPWFGFNADSRRTIQPGIWVNLGYWDAGRSHNMSLGPYLNFRVSSRFTVNFGANFFRADDDAQWIGNFTDTGGGRHYAFAHLDQRTVSFNVRVNYTMTPDLTFEFYGEPFASSGIYTDVREISATPDAWSYEARFQPYTPPAGTETSFSFRQVRTNAVVRWEYLPGSTLFLVWAHGRDESTENEPRRAWQRDLTGLFDLQADHTFLLKVSYWLNR